MSIICCLESDIIIIFLSIRQTGKNQTTGHQLPLLSEFECKRQYTHWIQICVSVMKFLFYHSQLRIREHLTHKQVLLNFSNYVFFVFIRTDLVIYFRMNSISPKKYQDILMLITVGEGTISPLTHLLPVSKSIIHTQLFFAGSH